MMYSRNVAIATRKRLLAALLLVASGGVQAQEAAPAPAPGDGPVLSSPLALVVGELPLPFSYRIRREALSVSTGRMFSLWHTVELVPVDGPRAGLPLTVNVRYLVPPTYPPGLVQGAVRKEGEDFAVDERTRAIEPFQSGGFGFTVADAWDKDSEDEEVRTIRLFGDVGGALVNLFLPDPHGGDGVSDLYGAARGFTLDYQATQRFGKRLQAESLRSTLGGQIHTVIGSLAPPEDFTPTVVSADVTRDGAGKILRARQSFHLTRKSQTTSFIVSCGLERPTDEAKLEQLRNPYEGDDTQATILSRGSGRLGTLEVERVDFIQDDTRTRKGSYRYADVGPGFVAVSLFHITGRPQTEHMEAQLAKLDPTCQPDSLLLTDPVPATAADAAPDA